MIDQFAPQVIVIGVAGSGKSTIGRLVAIQLAVPFLDADNFHSRSNISKMSAGIALTDEDRKPWLTSVAEAMMQSVASGSVMACSALRRTYRDTIRARIPDVIFAELSAPADVLETRVEQRRGHFLHKTLLESQLALLEPLSDQERGHRFDATAEPQVVSERIARYVLGGTVQWVSGSTRSEARATAG